MSETDRLTTDARIVCLHAAGVPSSHIARKLHIERREVNRVLREYEGRRRR